MQCLYVMGKGTIYNNHRLKHLNLCWKTKIFSGDGNYEHLGCFKDSYDRDLPTTHETRDRKRMTIDKCYQHCLSIGTYQYFGLQVNSIHLRHIFLITINFLHGTFQ